MTPTDPLHPRKQPRQTRSSATVSAVLDAAARVLEAHSLAGFNTNRVAEVAGVSIGSLYQYFPNKDALLTALIERAASQLAERMTTAIEQARGRSLREGVALLIGVAIAQQFDRPRLAAALDFMERQLPIDGRLAESRASLSTGLVEFLAWHHASVQGDLGHAAADVLAIVRALVDGAAQRQSVDLHELEARVERAVMGYLTTVSDPAARSTPRAARRGSGGRR